METIVQFPDVETTRLRCWLCANHKPNTGPPGCGDCIAEHDAALCRDRMRKMEPEKLEQSKVGPAEQKRKWEEEQRRKAEGGGE